MTFINIRELCCPGKGVSDELTSEGELMEDLVEKEVKDVGIVLERASLQWRVPYRESILTAVSSKTTYALEDLKLLTLKFENILNNISVNTNKNTKSWQVFLFCFFLKLGWVINDYINKKLLHLVLCKASMIFIDRPSLLSYLCEIVQFSLICNQSQLCKE